MPSWFYILMGCMALVAAIAIAAAVIVGTTVKRKARRVLAGIQRDDALVQSECMIRDGAIHCPGAALVTHDFLIVKSVFGRTRQFPLSSISVVEEGCGLGKYGWFGKWVFYLDTPETTNLAIGVKHPAPWRQALKRTKLS